MDDFKDSLTFGNRFDTAVKYYRNRLETKPHADFAIVFEIGRSALSQIKAGRSKPSVDVLITFASAAPEINMNWLLTGEGDMFITHDTDNSGENEELKQQIKVLIAALENANHTNARLTEDLNGYQKIIK